MATPAVCFTREPFTDALFAELEPLLIEHWREIAHYQDIPLAPDVGVYHAAEASGVLRVFTVRYPGLKWRPFLDPDQRSAAQIHAETNAMRKAGIAPDSLAGYAIFFVRPNPHYSGSVQAVQDVVFLNPSIRGGNGYRFIAWCDEQLRAEGVQAVYHHVKVSHDFGPMLQRQGYELVDLIYAKRLDSERDGQSARLTETSAETRPVRSGEALVGQAVEEGGS